MDKDTALLQAKTLLSTGEKHYYYDRVVKFAQEYEAHITGEGIEAYLKRYTVRESEDMFKQRVQLTNSINPAVTNSLMKPFYKVSRNNNVVKKYDFKDKGLNEKVAIMLNDFNGDKIDNTDGLEHWLRTRFVELTFADPNSFVVIEWDAVDATQTIKPRPFEVSSADAWNYEYKGQELQWLHVCTAIKYNKRANGKTKAANGFKFTLYGQGWTVASEQIDREYLNAVGFVLGNNQYFDDINGKTYLVSYYETKLNYVPAFRVGYARDLKTNGKTFVNPFNPAMPYLRKALKTCSELDITMTAHVFPQKLQYIQKCNGASPTETCNNGRCPTKNNAVCTACNGSGFKTITTAQEALYFPFPESKDDYLPLNDMLVYKSPPIDLVKFQDEYIRYLKQDTHLAVYNSNMFLSSDAQFAKTATEIDSNMDGIYDAIEPYSERYSKIWKLIVYTSAALAGFDLNTDEYDLLHAFPADPKLKTLSLLLADLKTVNDSNAPSFTRDIINNDIAEVIYNGDDEAMKRYKVRHIFYPFNGKTSEEISMLVASELVSENTKILYANFETIFTELEREKKNFYDLPTENQWKLVEEKVKAWKAEIIKSTPVTISFPNFGGGNAGEQTAGANDTPDDTGSEEQPAGTTGTAAAGAGGQDDNPQ